MELSKIFAMLDSGQFETLLQALEMMGFSDIGLDIDLIYGFSISISVGKDNILELAHTEVERYSLSKLYDKGGAIRVDLKWAEVASVMRGILYFNFRIGLVIILEGIIELVPQPLIQAMVASLNSLVQFNKNNRDVDVIEMRNFIPWFDDIYYNGVLQTGKDPSFIGNLLRRKKY